MLSHPTACVVSRPLSKSFSLSLFRLDLETSPFVMFLSATGCATHSTRIYRVVCKSSRSYGRAFLAVLAGQRRKRRNFLAETDDFNIRMRMRNGCLKNRTTESRIWRPSRRLAKNDRSNKKSSFGRLKRTSSNPQRDKIALPLLAFLPCSSF